MGAIWSPRRIGLLLLFPLSFFFPFLAFAGAWVQPSGEGLAILTLRHYHTDRYVDPQGARVKQPDYRKWDLAPYVEYGLDAETTLGGEIHFLDIGQDLSNRTSLESAGLGDTSLFVRRRLWQGTHGIVSVEPSILLPSPLETGKTPSLGSDATAVELKLNGGIGGELAGHHAFTDASVGYRRRMGGSGDQWRYAWNGGIDLTTEWQALAQLSGTFAAHAIAPLSAAIDDANDYDLVNLDLSALYRVNDRYGIQFGAGRALHARNTGDGTAAFVSVWRRF